jgi:glucose/arabinose dehydrogenase
MGLSVAFKRLVLGIFAALVIAIVAFFVGADFYQRNVWPFGLGFYGEVRSALGLPPPENVGIAKKRQGDEISLQTAYHKLKIYYFPEIPEGQLTLSGSKANSLQLIHVSVSGEVRLITVLFPPSNVKPNLQVKVIGTLSNVFDEAGGKVNDVFKRRDGSVLVSYTTADSRRCASMNLDQVDLGSAMDSVTQKTIYQTHPCTLPPYALHETGGRIVEDPSGNILFSVGAFGRDDKVLKDNTDFGKILILSKDSINELARGFRNPQGLFVDQETIQLYSTDHGPKGGDEINLVEKGKNYGWPLETYGFNYFEDTEREPFSNKGMITYGRHDNFKQPIFAFVPDIGIGQIARMPSDSYEFPNWLGDLFVAAMRDGSLLRVRFEHQYVMYVEPIELSRIRDFVITPSGIIVASSIHGLIVIRRALEGRG